MVWPILISLLVTPGASAATAHEVIASSASGAVHSPLCIRSSPVANSSKKACLAFSRCGCIAPEPGQRQPEEAGNAAGRDIHGNDEEDTGNRPGRRLRDLIGDVGHELDEDGAEERTRNRGNAADDDADEEAKREEGRE